MAIKVGDIIDVDIDSIPRVTNACGYTCPHCGKFHLALFDSEGNALGVFHNNDESWASLLAYIQRELKKVYVQ